MNKTVLWVVVGVGLAAALIAFAVMGIQKGVKSVSDQIQEEAAAEAGPDGQAEAAPPEGVSARAVEIMEQRLAFLGDINKIMSTGLADCPKMAERIEAYTQEHQGEMQALDAEERKLKREMDPATRSAYDDWALGRMKGAILKMVKLTALMVVKCPDEMASVEKATAEFEQ